MRFCLSRVIHENTEKGAKVVFVTVPDGLVEGKVPLMSLNQCLLIDAENYVTIHNLYIEKKKEVAELSEVDVLDLRAAFKEFPNYKERFFDYNENEVLDDIVYVNDPIHPNEQGRDLCTELYYDYIVNILAS
ncbi:MAG TPA: hypothetical protein ENN46_03220 [Candidatus Woesearchaeota archaeon]|nr:hypothetical protein [Candidatus Woesearchaeota archaeon]